MKFKKICCNHIFMSSSIVNIKMIILPLNLPHLIVPIEILKINSVIYAL